MKSENILKVINNFKKVLPMAVAECHLMMSEGEVNVFPHVCGTVHCHGGWYAIATCDLSKELDYEDGANQMAISLGFNVETDLERWANENSETWGNKDGCFMFVTRAAFFHPTKRPGGAENLQHIIDHWTEVYEMVKTKELLSEPPVDELIRGAIDKTAEPKFISSL